MPDELSELSVHQTQTADDKRKVLMENLYRLGIEAAEAGDVLELARATAQWEKMYQADLKAATVADAQMEQRRAELRQRINATGTPAVTLEQRKERLLERLKAMQAAGNGNGI